ncbi:protein LONGIFOLIA 1 [Forsythia ovata]|uniref:Protein LONGIFOLIA 1 n=1 Tax=Forsythia ovata TaxID=205694 RepID=A0ABD1X3Y0_9LAMI
MKENTPLLGMMMKGTLRRDEESINLRKDYLEMMKPASFDRMIFPETPSRNSAMNMQNSFPQFSQQALDLWDVVKDSMYMEVHGLSIKAKTIEAAPDLMVKFKDFSRPLLRITDGSQDSANFEKHLGIIMNGENF